MSIGAAPWPRGSVLFSTSMGNPVQPYWLGNESQRMLWTAGSRVQGVMRWKKSSRGAEQMCFHVNCSLRYPAIHQAHHIHHSVGAQKPAKTAASKPLRLSKS